MLLTWEEISGSPGRHNFTVLTFWEVWFVDYSYCSFKHVDTMLLMQALILCVEMRTNDLYPSIGAYAKKK